jgi:hypothetical protein
VDAALGADLGGKLLLLHDEYFTFELLYKNHTRHYHEEPRFVGKVTGALGPHGWMIDPYHNLERR